MNSKIPGQFDILAIKRAAERLSGHVTRTPVLNSPMLDQVCGCQVFVKAESLQKTGSFKIRGALNKILSLDAETLRRGVITYSAGNHGQGVAAGAKLIGCPAVIVLPKNAPSIKIENCRWWGAEIVLYDPHTQDRAEVAQKIVEQRGMTFISPFDDFDVMAGQGTTGLELCEQLEEAGITPDAIVVNCSGGGLSAGVITALKVKWPEVDAYIVEPVGFDKMAHSFISGIPEKVTRVPDTIMDAIAGPAAGAKTLPVLLQHGVHGLTVNDNEAKQAVRSAFRFLKLVVEPGGAASLAAVMARKADFTGKKVALICSGGNVDPSIFMHAISE
jgi:threonine dehydratase